MNKLLTTLMRQIIILQVKAIEAAENIYNYNLSTVQFMKMYNEYRNIFHSVSLLLDDDTIQDDLNAIDFHVEYRRVYDDIDIEYIVCTMNI